MKTSFLAALILLISVFWAQASVTQAAGGDPLEEPTPSEEASDAGTPDTFNDLASPDTLETFAPPIDVSDVPSPLGDWDAGPTDADSANVVATEQTEPDASAPTCAPCPPPAPERPILEIAIEDYVFNNEAVPFSKLSLLSCEEFVTVRDAIWGRHGYFFPDNKMRADFTAHYEALYVPLPHVHAETIKLYLTAPDNLTLALIGFSAFHKGCNRSALAP